MSSVIERIKSIIFLNGSLSEGLTRSPFLQQGLPLIAADGAAWSMKAVGLTPDIIIGDLDSLNSQANPERSFPKAEIIEVPDQETNDFEKSLRLIDKRNLSPVLVVGMQGGDLEHSFNNWSVAIKLSQELELWILEQDRVGIGLGQGGNVKARSGIDKKVSLIPQPKSCVTTTGLRWPLSREILELGVREGARNEVLEQKKLIPDL
jgi:thiamine pyrophosphokinase